MELAKFGEKEVIKEATRKPAKRSNPLRIVYRVLRTKGRHWHALIAWAVAVMIGARSAASLFTAALSPLAILTRQKDVTPASVVENMGIANLLTVLNSAGEADLKGARKDCQVIARPSNSWSLARLILMAVRRRMYALACLLSGLVGIRGSADHQGSFAEALGISEAAQ